MTQRSILHCTLHFALCTLPRSLCSKLYAICTILFLLSSHTFSAGLSDNLEKLLVRAGFENVAILEFNNDLIITYENRIYRYEMDALAAVMGIASKKIISSNEDLESLEKAIQSLKEKIEAEEARLIPDTSSGINDQNNSRQDGREKLEYLDVKDYQNIILLPSNRGVPVVAVTIPFQSWKAFSDEKINGEILAEEIDISFDTDDVWWLLKGEKKNNRSYLKLDLVVYPLVKTELDKYDDPYRIQFSLAPSLETSLGQGSLIRLQYLIPVIYNEFDVGLPQDKFRPGLMNLNQTLRLPQSFFVSTTIGIFSDNRYGIDIEVRKYLLNGILSLGINSGFTGNIRFYDGSYDISILEELTYFFDTEVRIPVYNLSMAVQYGQYINQDKGFRFDIARQFGEFDIGFFVEKSSSDLVGNLTTGGFYFAVPLWPSEYSDPGFIRIRPSEQFHWEYNATHFIYFQQKRYKTGNDVDHFLKRLQPDNIKTYFKKLEPIPNNSYIINLFPKEYK